MPLRKGKTLVAVQPPDVFPGTRPEDERLGAIAPPPLFRAEAQVDSGIRGIGEVVIVSPVAFSVYAILVGLASVALILFLTLATYTRRTTVTGQLRPEFGVLKVYVPQSGIVVEKKVTQGQKVHKGDVLFVISSDRASGIQGATQAAISALVEARQHSLNRNVDQTLRLQEMTRVDLNQKIATLRAEIASDDALIEEERARRGLAQQDEARYADLLAQGLLSQDEYRQKQAELLDQTTRLESSRRDRIKAAGDLLSAQGELRSLSLKDDNSVEQIRRDIDAASQELVESEAKRRVDILAPQDGEAATVVAEVGEVAEPSKPLASILPEGSKLQAHLYVPSKATGFITIGNRVVLRYQAYPYQKFGSFGGTVVDISKTSLSGDELTRLNNFAPKADEPMYLVAVSLDSQAPNIAGRTRPLQVGMLLDADVLQETRRLYEWALEPLYAIAGKL